MFSDYKNVKSWTCPWCFARQNDSAPLFYDKKEDEYYCVKGCLTGSADKIVEEYQSYQKRYRMMGVRMNILGD